MRFLLNLSVGRKLAASAMLAVAMLVGLVAATWQETGRGSALQGATRQEVGAGA